MNRNNRGQDGQDGQAGALTLLPVMLAGMWRRRRWVVAATVIGGMLGTFRAVVTPSSYRSGGTLLVKPGLRDVVSAEAAFSGVGAGRMTGAREAILNEMYVLAGSQLFDLVVEKIGADAVIAPFDPAAADTSGVPWHTSMMHRIQSWWFSDGGVSGGEASADRKEIASRVLKQNVIITPEPGASVISVYYFASSPERARVVVDAVLEAAREMHRRVFDEMSGLEKMKAERESSEEVARKAETALREFSAKEGIYGFEAQQESMFDYVVELDRQIDAIDLDLIRLRAERATLATQLGKLPETRLAPGSESFVINPAFVSITEQLTRLNGALLDLNLDRNKTDDSAKRRKDGIEQQIKVQEALRDTTPPQIKLEGTNEINPEHARISQRVAEIDVSVSGSDSKRGKLDTLRTEMRTALQKFEALKPIYRNMDLDAKQKRAVADRFAEGVSNLLAVQRLEQLNLSSIVIMHRGSLEPEKVAPRRSRLVFLSTFGGMAFGLALTAIWALFDRRVRVPADLQRLGIPADGVLIGHVDEPGPGVGALSPSLVDARTDISRLWSSLSYERRGQGCLKIACAPCGAADAGRAAGALALGLALHGGERVAYVSCVEGGGWLAKRLELTQRRGWTDVVQGKASAADVVVKTSIAGLDYYGAGKLGAALPHPMTGRAFLEFLEELGRDHRFVVVELPDLVSDPAGRSVLGSVDGAQLVVLTNDTKKDDLKVAIAAVRASGARLLGCVLQPVGTVAGSDATATSTPEASA